MNAEVAYPSRTSTSGKVHRIWMDVILLSPFAVRRALYLLLVPPAILGVSMYLGQGVLGLVLMAVACWPLRFHLQVSPEGLLVSWLMLQEKIRWEEIRSAKLAIDGRKFVIGRRKPVLVLERHGNRSVTLRGEAHVLSQIAAEISPHVGLNELRRADA
jgi:hypothetical protein